MTTLYYILGAGLTIGVAATISLRFALFTAGLVCLWTWRVLVNTNRN